MSMMRHKGMGKHRGRKHDKRPQSTTTERRKPDMDLTTFKNYNTTRADLDDLVAMAAFGRSLRAEYEAHQLDEPEFIGAKLKSLRAEIADRNADKVAARKRELAARIDSLKSPREKKAELLKELAELENVGA